MNPKNYLEFSRMLGAEMTAEWRNGELYVRRNDTSRFEKSSKAKWLTPRQKKIAIRLANWDDDLNQEVR